MADIVNPYANPYLPSFVNQRPRMNDVKMQPSVGSVVFSQIHPVKGYEGADAYSATLAAGSSEILSESDPNIARIYVVAKDQNGQTFVQGFGLVPDERPKPITMDDLNAKMSELLERMDKLETEKVTVNAQPNNGSSWKGPKQSNDSRAQSNVRDGQSGRESSGNANENAGK